MRLIGHRGAPALAPENTLASFRAALDAGADGVELDARLTADGRLVVMHDDDVARTTDGAGRVSAMTLDEVRALDAAARMPGWREREPVPTLEEALELASGRAEIFLEVKGALTAEGYRSATEVVWAAADLVRGVPDLVVSSFEPEALAEARVVLPGIPTALAALALVDPGWALDVAVDAGHSAVHPEDEGVDAALVTRAHAAGVEVYPWTVNDPARLRALRDMGADGVFTDDPGAARAALGS